MSGSSLFDLSGQVAVVTGVSRGIGAGMALALAAAGADIIGVSRNVLVDGGDVGVAVRKFGRAFTPVRCDLAHRASVDGLIETLKGVNIDILVNNAGLARRAPAEQHSDEFWDEVFAVNLTEAFRLTRSIGEQMLQRGSGKIIFMASMMSYQGGRNVVGYAATKSGITGVVHALANEWAGRGVNVNAIAPGYIETALTAGTHQDTERRQQFTDRIPAGHWGKPDDLAGAVIFLSSRASDYVHGVVLPVDGGWLVR